MSEKQLRAALNATSVISKRWVHNAAITNDIEKLRAIALAYSDWNNCVLMLLRGQPVYGQEQSEAFAAFNRELAAEAPCAQQ